ncbi:MAG: hypothetical protein ACRD1K_01045 [Acidimicrobiales bacterium]
MNPTRQGLPAAEALVATRRAFVAAGCITPANLAAKVAARFPAGQPLPVRPELDRLVAAYPAPAHTARTGSAGSPLSRLAIAVPTTSVTPAEVDVAADFRGPSPALAGRRRAPRPGGPSGRTSCAAPRSTSTTGSWTNQYSSPSRPAELDLMVEADPAGPGSARWLNLTEVVDRALARLLTAWRPPPGTVLVSPCGRLARYRRLDIVARWRDASTTGDGP